MKYHLQQRCRDSVVTPSPLGVILELRMPAAPKLPVKPSSTPMPRPLGLQSASAPKLRRPKAEKMPRLSPTRVCTWPRFGPSQLLAVAFGDGFCSVLGTKHDENT